MSSGLTKTWEQNLRSLRHCRVTLLQRAVYRPHGNFIRRSVRPSSFIRRNSFYHTFSPPGNSSIPVFSQQKIIMAKFRRVTFAWCVEHHWGHTLSVFDQHPATSRTPCVIPDRCMGIIKRLIDSHA